MMVAALNTVTSAAIPGRSNARSYWWILAALGEVIFRSAVFHRDRALLAHVAAQHARKFSEIAWTRLPGGQRTFRGDPFSRAIIACEPPSCAHGGTMLARLFCPAR